MTAPNINEPLPRDGEHRLYQRLARTLFEEMSAGTYAVGERLPAERELSSLYRVSRPAVREAMIALEVQGYIEVRVGAGAYVRRPPGQDARPDPAISALELAEARMMFEGEAAAQAARHITAGELAELDAMVDGMAAGDDRVAMTENADRAFHLAIARATRNAAIVQTIEHFWQLRTTSAECALLHDMARRVMVRPVVEEHRAVVQALRLHDPAAARQAMRAHLAAVIERLLFATEAKAIEEARRAVASTRARYTAVGAVAR